MRVAYNEQMTELADLLGEMAALAGSAMERATQSLLQADLRIAEQVIGDHEKITDLSAQAEERSFALLALQAPVAGDLRSVVSGIQIVADIDRMGALALHVAKIARRRHPQHALPEEVNGYFAEMGRIAVALGSSAREVLETRDPADWAAAIASILRDPALAERLSVAAREHALAHSWDLSAEGLLAVFRQLVVQSGQGSSRA